MALGCPLRPLDHFLPKKRAHSPCSSLQLRVLSESAQATITNTTGWARGIEPEKPHFLCSGDWMPKVKVPARLVSPASSLSLLGEQMATA